MIKSSIIATTSSIQTGGKATNKPISADPQPQQAATTTKEQ
jgi:hypothetical protein